MKLTIVGSVCFKYHIAWDLLLFFDSLIWFCTFHIRYFVFCSLLTVHKNDFYGWDVRSLYLAYQDGWKCKTRNWGIYVRTTVACTRMYIRGCPRLWQLLALNAILPSTYWLTDWRSYSSVRSRKFDTRSQAWSASNNSYLDNRNA